MSNPDVPGDEADHRGQCVALVPIFRQLDVDERQQVAGRARQQTFARGAQLYRAGEANRHLMIVHSGRVKVSRVSGSGREQLIRVMGPGDFIGENSVINATPADDFAVTLEETEICSLHHDDVRALLLSFPSITFKMLETMSTRLERAERLVNSLTGKNVEQRLASYLLELREPAGADEVVLPITKKDLASHLGTTPETVSRRLAAFEQNGWISQGPRGRMHILDPGALAAI